MTETLANGYSSESARRELSNEYQHDRVSMVFIYLCILVYWTKVVIALEGLRSRVRVCPLCTSELLGNKFIFHDGQFSITIATTGQVMHVLKVYTVNIFIMVASAKTGMSDVSVVTWHQSDISMKNLTDNQCVFCQTCLNIKRRLFCTVIMSVW